MLTQRLNDSVRFTRRDAGRLGTSAVVLVVVLTLMLGIDILVPQPLTLEAGDVARSDIIAPATRTFESEVQTESRRQEARDAVTPQYDFTPQDAALLATQQVAELRRALVSVDAAFRPSTDPTERRAILAQALPGLSEEGRQTLLALDPARWPVVKEEAESVLEAVERTELRDTDLLETRQGLAARMRSELPEAERRLASEIISPFVVANSTFSAGATEAERARRAEMVEPVQVTVRQGQAIVRANDVIDEAEVEIAQQLGLLGAAPDVARLGGWFLLATLLVGLLLAWVWRFRRDLWHRNNVLILVGVLLVLAAFALKVTAGRQALPFLIPTAAVGMLVAILLDAGAATVLTAVLAVVAGAVNGASLEVASYVFLGGFSGIVAIRRGDRLQTFLQAGIAVFIVQALVVSSFSLLGTRDLRGIIELWGASAVAGGGAAVAAVGASPCLGTCSGSSRASSCSSWPIRRSRSCGASSLRHRARTTTRSWSATSPSGRRRRSAPIPS